MLCLLPTCDLCNDELCLARPSSRGTQAQVSRLGVHGCLGGALLARLLPVEEDGLARDLLKGDLCKEEFAGSVDHSHSSETRNAG